MRFINDSSDILPTWIKGTAEEALGTTENKNHYHYINKKELIENENHYHDGGFLKFDSSIYAHENIL